MAEQKGTEITSRDLATGHTATMTITDDVCVITDGTAYVAGVQDYPKSGTQVWTIKGRKGKTVKR